MTCKFLARTGRVQDWIDNPESRLPVSCTVFQVDDSIEGPEGIEASWRFASHALRNAAGVAIHLQKLRPSGTDNGKGLISSGPVSFGKIYSVLNEVLRRGGLYRSGAIVLHYDLNCPDILEFITTPREELPWVKRCVDLKPEWWYEAPIEIKEALLQGIRTGDIWLSKVKYQDGERIFSNVCLEVYLPSRGTCLLSHLNLGQCDIKDIETAFIEGMESLCELHPKTGVGETGEYLPPEKDKQVGLGLLGLANLLAIKNITYKEFGDALEHVNSGLEPLGNAGSLALAFKRGINKAAIIARKYGMLRAFCIAPTATCSYKYTDAEGYTTAPEIAPPIYKEVDRDSGHRGVESFSYNPNTEIAVEVGWHTYKKVADQLVKMYESTGLFHGYSFNSWSDQLDYDEAFIEDWIRSPQTSLYYSLQVSPETLRKDDVTSLLDEEYEDIFNPVLFEEQLEEEKNNFCSSCAE